MSDMARVAPSPMEAHPAYRDAGLQPLLSQENPPPMIRWPILTSTRAHFGSEPEPFGEGMKIRPLAVHKAAALAPWTGQPYHYEWWVARDELGRMVAGDARQVFEHMDATPSRKP
jgi:hypothetical protein